jgi:hypothetical protein
VLQAWPLHPDEQMHTEFVQVPFPEQSVLLEHLNTSGSFFLIRTRGRVIVSVATITEATTIPAIGPGFRGI